ncbi:MAG: hypothetical protein ACT4OO_00085 [Nitrospiraceae bacterium]
MLLLLVGLIVATSLIDTGPAVAQENRWGFGTDIGFLSGTTNGTVFALGVNLDYYMDRNFSFGPMMLLTPIGDLTQIALAGVAKYHLRFNNGVNLVPFAGFGLVHADLDRGSGPGRIDRNDTSHYIPLGLSLEYQLTPQVALASTLMVNLHNITLSPPIDDDKTSIALMFGFRWGP